RLGLLGRDHRDGHDGAARLESETRDAGLSAVETTVGAARALGVDAEQPALAQPREPRVERCLRRLAARAVDGDRPDAAEELRLEPALEARAREVLGLADEDDLAVEDDRQDERVDDGEVVAREDRPAGRGHVLEPAGPRAEVQLQPGTGDDLLHEPVEQRSFLLAPPTGRTFRL